MNDSSHMRNVERWNLSYESCRKCGGTLKKYSLCAICRQAMQHICMQCGSKSEGMSHPCHTYGDMRQSRRSMMEDAYQILA